MSFDVGGGGIAAAIQQAFSQPMNASQPAALAQQFEAGLIRASETSAISTKQLEESRFKATEVDDIERKLVTEIPEMKMAPPETSRTIESRLVNYMESFHDRTKSFSAAMKEVSDGVGGPKEVEGNAASAKPSTQPPGTGSNDTQVAMQMLERSFTFAIETTLVSKASTESTRVFNNLLKGQ